MAPLSGTWARAAYGLAAIAVLALLPVLVVYALYPGYQEHGEANISILAFRLLKGLPVYHSFLSPDRFTNLYGPYTYLWHAWPLALFGTSVTASKLAGVAAPALAVLAMALPYRRLGGAAVSLALALGGGFVLMHLAFPITIRPDALMIVAAAVGVAAAASAERKPGMAWAETILMGVAAGVAVNLKLYAPLVFAPLGLFHVMGDWRRLPVVALAAAAVAGAPFLLPQFPLDAYLSWFGGMMGKENEYDMILRMWWKLALYLGLPITAWVLAGRRAWAAQDWRLKLVLPSYVLCLGLLLFPASKSGAGHHYLLPLVPTLIFLCLRAWEAGGRPVQARALVLGAALVLVLGYQPQRRFYKGLDWDEARAAVAEIQAILAAYPGQTVQMGVGGVTEGDPLTYRFYHWRNLPVYAGNPFTLDAAIVMEMTKVGVPMADEALRRLETCQTNLWLVPAGEEPFSLWGYYHQYVFDDRFRAAFQAHHDKVAGYRFFDVWRCRTEVR